MSDYENWEILKKHVKHQWGKLTDADLMEIDGYRPRLVAKLEQHYGWKTEHAKEALRQFERSLSKENIKHKKDTYPGKPIP